MQNNLLKKFLTFSYGSWISLILGLITTMLATRILPPEAFGKVSMFELFLQVGLIISIFGTDQSFVRFFYEEEPDKRGALLYNTLRLPILSTFIVISILIICYKPITYYLFDKESFSFALWLGVAIIAQLLFRYAQLVIRMQQKGNLYSIIQICQRLFNLIFIIIFAYILGARYEVLVFSNIFTIILVAMIAIYIEKEFWNIKNFKKAEVKHSQKNIIKFGAPFVLTIFITWLFESFDKIALRQWSDFAELGLYGAAMKLVALVIVLKQTFSTFWTPVAYERFENNPSDKSFFKNITIIVSFCMFVVSIISIAAKDLIIMFLGSEYETAASIMPFLIFMPVLYTISETTVIGINFYKKTQLHIVIAGIACIVNILGNWLLVPLYGALGASLSTAFAFIIFFTLRTQISYKYYKVNYPLIKIYFMLLVLSIYAMTAIINEGIIYNIFTAILCFMILTITYYKDLKTILKTNNLNFFKKKLL